MTRPKKEHSSELENVVKMVQNLSKKIVDLEKDKEASSSKKTIQTFFQEKRGRCHISTASISFSCFKF